MTRSNLARNCEEIVEIDRDIVEVCRRLDERGQKPRNYDCLLEMLDILAERKQALLEGRSLPTWGIAMPPIALTDSQLQEVLQAARMVPFGLRH
jgi:hypothetical protein